ncbi:Conserved oligomeric Golgi complex subunit 5 [Durusdinium trenchii]|uniref:Conserved oligomeric Golgi complex subunit 5 n=1 Tax=Durusdinium trenchii TaxID=1381693 RepID=A0ABP0NQY8_9DINO
MACFVQSYAAALAERVQRFPAEPSEDRGRRRRRGGEVRVPATPVQYQVTTLSRTADGAGLLGTSLSGDEVFLLQPFDPPRSAGELLTALGELLEVPPARLTLLRAGAELPSKAALGEVEGLTLREGLVDCRPLLCRLRAPNDRAEPSLGEGTVEVDVAKLPEGETIQAIREERRYVTMEEACWLSYTSKQVISYAVGADEVLEPYGFFPLAPQWRLPAGASPARRAAPNCDVWSCQLGELAGPMKAKLDAHARRTNDRPIPRYQMIVDPNQFVHQQEGGPVWVPSEFDVTREGSCRLVGGDRSHLEPRLAQEVAQPVLEAALPLLAKLRRPQLLLEDRRLQVVFKAQRIIVPGRHADGSDAEYVGLWHVDGHREHVAAVVLYYYHVDPQLEGGDMEFCGREPMDVLGIGDCSNNYGKFHAASVRAALRDGPETRVANCRVPIREGTLLVFSNCQLVHRVLKMVNSGTHEASRDFVALFVLDPAFGELRPARSVLSAGYHVARALQRCGVGMMGCPQAVSLILEFLGIRPSAAQRKLTRNALLREQLQPSGEFCGSSQVHATGNGCYSMIGWLHHLLGKGSGSSLWMFEGADWNGHKLLQGLNLPPEQLGRGMSEILSLDTVELDCRLEYRGLRSPSWSELE